MNYELGFKIYRNIAFICLFLILLTTYSFAQDKGFRGGILFGAVTSQVDGDMLNGYNKGGLQAGIFLNNRFSKKTGIQIEMKYIQKGSRTTSPPPDSVNVVPDRYYKLRLNYIEVPFMLNIYFKKKFAIEGGLGFAYLFRVREDKDGYGMEPVSKYDKQFNRFEFPAVLGVTFYLTEKFHINFRTSYSILPIRAHPANQSLFFDRGQYNNLLSFGMFLNI